MTALLVEHLKLIILILLIGPIIGPSHLGSANAKPTHRKRRSGYGRPASARL